MKLLQSIGRSRKCELLLGISLFLLVGCGKNVLTGGPVDGVVLESTTLQSVPDAMVLVKWRGVLPTVHSNSVPCYHVELATTDPKGKYHTNAWKIETKGLADWVAHINQTGPIEAVVYKRGYAMPLTHQEDPMRVLVEPFNGTTRERLVYLIDRFDREIMCEADDKSLTPFYRAAYEEGKATAKSPGDLEFVDILLIGLESAQYGNSIALDRSAERRLQRMQEQRIEGKK